jgi:hypothetical protein
MTFGVSLQGGLAGRVLGRVLQRALDQVREHPIQQPRSAEITMPGWAAQSTHWRPSGPRHRRGAHRCARGSQSLTAPYTRTRRPSDLATDSTGEGATARRPFLLATVLSSRACRLTHRSRRGAFRPTSAVSPLPDRRHRLEAGHALQRRLDGASPAVRRASMPLSRRRSFLLAANLGFAAHISSPTPIAIADSFA